MSIYLRSAIASLAAIAMVAGFQATTAEAKTVVIQAPSPALGAGASYAWAPTSSALIDPASSAAANRITAQRLQNAIETNLAAHGYRQAPGLPVSDLTVSFHVGLKQRSGTRIGDTGATFCGLRGCLRTWSGNPTVTAYEYTQGSLVIDLVDRRTGRLVWRAASQDRVAQKDLSQVRLNAIVAKMMKSLPPA